MSEEAPSLYQYYRVLLRPAPFTDHYQAYVVGRELALALIDDAETRLEELVDTGGKREIFLKRLREFKSKIARLPFSTHKLEDFEALGRTLIRLHIFLRRVEEFLKTHSDGG